MFVDTAKVKIQAGKGGDGAVSFRREIYVDKGGPDGGNGGRGGDVVFCATNNLNTLIDFRYKPELKAKDGENGGKRKMYGKSGKNCEVKVPVGTIVKVNGKVLADLVEDGQIAVVAQGGDGGFGNAHFKSSTRQTPRVAEIGEMGEAFEAELELKLLADVGLLGFPNAGKSTFLSVVSNATPEIANYEFTTLTPNLGVADVDEYNLLIADIPGLIEGASSGRGLGDKFLRHVERTSVLLHLIDVYEEDVAGRYQIIRKELSEYSQNLAKRKELVCLTKTEGFDDELLKMQIEKIKKVSSSDVMVISSQAHFGIKEVLRKLVKMVAESRTEEKATQMDEVEDFELEFGEIPVIGVKEEDIKNSWSVEKVKKDGEVVYEVSGQKIEKFARRTNYEYFEGVNRLRDIMKKMGIMHELSRKGAVSDSVIKIGENYFTMLEQRD